MQLKPQKSFEYEGDSGLKRFKILAKFIYVKYVCANQ